MIHIFWTFINESLIVKFKNSICVVEQNNDKCVNICFIITKKLLITGYVEIKKCTLLVYLKKSYRRF